MLFFAVGKQRRYQTITFLYVISRMYNAVFKTLIIVYTFCRICFITFDWILFNLFVLSCLAMRLVCFVMFGYETSLFCHVWLWNLFGLSCLVMRPVCFVMFGYDTCLFCHVWLWDLFALSWLAMRPVCFVMFCYETCLFCHA